MDGFLNQIYSIDNIIIYIIVAIAVLVVLFFVILIFGKKDQKLEETKRLEALNNEEKETNAFKEENNEPSALEVKEPIADKYPDILIPAANNGNAEKVEDTPIELEAEVKNEELEEKTITIPFEEINEAPILQKTEEKPLVINDSVDTPIIPSELNIPEPEKVEITEFNGEPEEKNPDISIVDSFANVEVPEIPIEKSPVNNTQEIKEINFDSFPSEINNNTEGNNHYERPTGGYDGSLPRPQIFSSVYVNEIKPEVKEEQKAETLSIKDLPKVDTNSDEEEFELPILKKKEEMPNAQGFTINSIEGETYNIK